MANDLPTPETRREIFLAAAAGESVTKPEPITREEMFLNAISGSSDIESLEDVIITDPQNAEVLKYDADQASWVNGTASGGGGTSDYTDLTNKPKINNVTLAGNKSLSDLGIVEVTELTNAQIDTIMNG